MGEALNRAATEFAKDHPLLGAAGFILLGVLMTWDATSKATNDRLMLAAEDTRAEVTEVTAIENGKTRVRYAWKHYGEKHSETIATDVPALRSLQAGDAVAIGIHPEDEDRGLPKAYLQARQDEYVTVGPLTGTDLMYAGLPIIAFGLLWPVIARFA